MLASDLVDVPLEIRQGSWTQLKHGHQRREFEYQIEHRDIFSTSCQGVPNYCTCSLQLAYDDGRATLSD